MGKSKDDDAIDTTLENEVVEHVGIGDAEYDIIEPEVIEPE